jgi:serine/threonine protein kinase
LRRNVALKLLPLWATQDEGWVSRFEQEALAASRLNHPNVPVVYEAGNVEGRHFIATEFVEGTTLAERVANGPLSWREALPIAICVGRALEAAHACGIIHRDVKPGNILLGKDGSVKLTDFGIAKLGELGTQRQIARPLEYEDERLTSPGMVMGTPDFMSPEQAAGLPIDHRTDIWNLAMVLREMVVRDSSTSETGRQEELAAVPTALRSALRHALEKNRDLRFPTMREFVQRLEAVSKSDQYGWRAILASPQFWLAASVLLCLAGLFVWQMLQHERTARQPFRIGRPVKLTNSGNVVEAAISPDNRNVLYIVEEGGERSIRLREVESGADRERIGGVGVGYSRITISPDGTSFYYLLDPHKLDERELYRAPLLSGPPTKIIEDVDSSVAISPDGRRIEFERGYPDKGYNALFVAATDGSQIQQIARRPYPASFLYNGATWTGDGRKIITGAFDNQRRIALFEVNATDGAQRQVSRWSWRWMGRVNSFANSSALVFAAAEQNVTNHQIFQFSLNDRTVSTVRADLSDYEDASTSSRSIVVVQKNLSSAVWIFPFGGTARSQRITPPVGQYRDVTSAPDGSVLVSTGNGRELNIWRIFTNGSSTQLTKGPYVDWHPAVSRDGKSIAFLSNRGGGLHVWICNSEGESLHQVAYGASADYSPSFTPDGWIVYNEVLNGLQAVVKLRPGGSERASMLAGAQSPIVAPSGKYFACVFAEEGKQQQWVVIDLKTQKVSYRFPNVPINSWVRWTADSGGILYIKTRNGVSNIILQALGKGLEKQLTNFEENMIFSFDVSSDGRNLALVRGFEESDAVLLQSEP